MCVGKVVGRISFDLTSIGSIGPRIPETAQGMMVTWFPDKNGNAAGSIKLYLGDARSAPWGYMKASVNQQSMLSGPLAEVWERGAYIRVEIIGGTGAAQGDVLFEFTEQPLQRYAYA